ncbi:hypothetical protein [Arthrobacter sp. Ld5]|uniref:hypothetical protein n=1 Tax=Arthrobacter sp. Ld5 TaxID=649152 RepID=UPI003EBB6BA1
MSESSSSLIITSTGAVESLTTDPSILPATLVRGDENNVPQADHAYLLVGAGGLRVGGLRGAAPGQPQ